MCDLCTHAGNVYGPSDAVFVDGRTGKILCHECVAALVMWEMDGKPDPDDHPAFEWALERKVT